MDKNKLHELKKRIIAIGLLGVMLTTAGCQYDKNGKPKLKKIHPNYNHIDNYRTYIIRNGEAICVYNANNIIIAVDKKTYESEEYLWDYKDILLGRSGELYDLESEEMLVYSDGIATGFNEFYVNDYLKNNFYCINFTKLANYIEGIVVKDYYTLEEIKEIEPLLIEAVKKIDQTKVKKLNS